MPRSLIIGYGNLDRADDGVAYHVINGLRRRLRQEILHEDDTGLEDLGEETDSVFLVQLAPELIDVLAGYGRIIFVDAHVGRDMDGLSCEPVLPEYASSTFTHHMTPAMLLALLKMLCNVEPVGYLLSIRGYDFDFHRNLSKSTEALVDRAVEKIMQLLALQPGQD
jgi:hydrogenase maturation protease